MALPNKGIVATAGLHIDAFITPNLDITAAKAVVDMTVGYSGPLTSLCEFTAILRQDGIGSRTFAWPAAVHWAGTAPQPGSGAPILIRLYSMDNGVTWYDVTA